MNPTPEDDAAAVRRDVDRLVAFSDGVFAIAITLLVLSLTVPTVSDKHLGKALQGLLPELFTYGLSFLVVGMFWMAHHRTFRSLVKVDRTLLWINLAVLGFVALLPFPTEILGRYGDTTLGTVVYAAAICAVGTVSVLLWWYMNHAGLNVADAASRTSCSTRSAVPSRRQCSPPRSRSPSSARGSRSSSGSPSSPPTWCWNAATARRPTARSDPRQGVSPPKPGVLAALSSPARAHILTTWQQFSCSRGSELRRRWRSALALVLFVGIIGGIVLASAAGAHRSATALDRFITDSRSSSAEVDVTDPTAAQLQAFRRSPQVVDLAVLHAYGVTPHGAPNLKNAATIDGRLGAVVDRARLVAGRQANPNTVDEVAIGQGLAHQLHVGIGDQLEADSITPGQLVLASQNQDPGPPAGPLVRLRVVGIVRRPLDLGDLSASGGVVIETPAFDRAYRGRVALFTTVLRVVTRDGAADIPAVASAARRAFGSKLSGVQNVTTEARGGEDAINVLTLALWLFAAVAAVAGGVAIAIVLSRDIAQEEIDQETLASLGLTRRERVAKVGGRVLLIALGGAVVAAALAIALSPRFPIGIAREAEPSPGVRVDGIVLGIGVVALAAFVVAIGALAAVRTTRLPSKAVSRAPRSRRSFSDRAAEAGLRPTFTNGVRMALEPGRGRRSLPVRSAFFGAVFGVVGLTAALVFGASLGHLDATPKLYGWTWDFKAPDDTFTLKCGASDYGLGAQPGVAAVRGSLLPAGHA